MLGFLEIFLEFIFVTAEDIAHSQKASLPMRIITAVVFYGFIVITSGLLLKVGVDTQNAIFIVLSVAIVGAFMVLTINHLKKVN